MDSPPPAVQRGKPLSRDRRILSVFRPDWYLRHHRDLATAGIDPVDHFLAYGVREDRDPSILFNSAWYRERYQVLQGDSALVHYLEVGHRHGHDPSPSFDTRWYRLVAGDIPRDVSPLEHYFTSGWKRGLSPHPAFDTAYDVERNTDRHFPDVTPYEEFMEFLWKGNLASPTFIPEWYLRLNPDVKEAGAIALRHYLDSGKKDGRRCVPYIEHDWYRRQTLDDPLASWVPLSTHFVYFGYQEGRSASQDLVSRRLAEHVARTVERARQSLMAVPDKESPLGARLETDWNHRVEALAVQSSSAPLVSVIIPTLNHSEDVIRCLESIRDAADVTEFEVVLVDDGSTTLHSARFARLRGVRVVTHDVNHGFSRACQTGIDNALGRYIMLLNNDTEVLPGWLDSLVGTLESDSQVGVVGSMIIRPDLLLQEAGVILWSDGYGYAYGSGDSPLEWRYRFSRVVDYCSGASLLFARALWDEVGGFDPAFEPAYYEDSDLCMSVASTGKLVKYQPASMVVHNEGRSHGNTGLGTKRFQFVNRGTFVKKWERELGDHFDRRDDPDAVTLVTVRERSDHRHVVVFEPRLLRPDFDSGSLRMHRILEAMVAGGLRIHFHSSEKDEVFNPWREEMAARGVEFLSSRSDVATLLSALQNELEFVWIARPNTFVDIISTIKLHAPAVPVVYDMVDAHGLRLRRAAQLRGDSSLLVEAAALERREVFAANASDIVVSVTEQDEVYINDVVGRPCHFVRIPNVHLPVAEIAPLKGRDGLLFVGGYEHPPNVDAVEFLVREIMPIVWQRYPELKLCLAGSKPTKEVLALAGRRVQVPGWVADLAPLYASHRIAVAPLRFGAGIKGKIGEAMSHGVPVVTTSVGAEGFDARPGLDMEVADSAEEFAEAVFRLLEDDAHWAKLGDNGRKLVEARVGGSVLHERFALLMKEVSKLRTSS